MNKSELLEKFKNDILQTEQDISENMNIADLEDWDSLAIISTIAFFDKELNKKITFDDIQKITTIKDLINLSGI